MGEKAFADMVRAFVSRHPVEQPNVYLPQFLASTSPYSRKAELHELALLENALNDAAAAPKAPFLTFDEFAICDPCSLWDAALEIHPSTSRLRMTTNVTSLWSSIRCSETPPSPYRLDVPQEVLIWRQNGSPRFRLLGDEEARAFDSAIKGASLGVIGEGLAENGADAAARRIFDYLRGWIEAQAISRIRFSEIRPPNLK